MFWCCISSVYIMFTVTVSTRVHSRANELFCLVCKDFYEHSKGYRTGHTKTLFWPYLLRTPNVSIISCMVVLSAKKKSLALELYSSRTMFSKICYFEAILIANAHTQTRKQDLGVNFCVFSFAKKKTKKKKKKKKRKEKKTKLTRESYLV